MPNFGYTKFRFFKHLECDTYRDSQLHAELDFLNKTTKTRLKIRKSPNDWQSAIFSSFAKLTTKPSRESLISKIQERLEQIQPKISFFTKPPVQESPRPDELPTQQTLSTQQLSNPIHFELQISTETQVQSTPSVPIPEARQKLYTAITNTKIKLSSNLQDFKFERGIKRHNFLTEMHNVDGKITEAEKLLRVPLQRIFYLPRRN